jgi:TatA/E family protein of Tat protein translocase
LRGVAAARTRRPSPNDRIVTLGRDVSESPKEHAVLGPQDLWIALALGVFFFGAKKLPELSRSLGQAMSEFKKGVATGGPDEPAAPATPPASGPAKTEATPESGKTQP